MGALDIIRLIRSENVEWEDFYRELHSIVAIEDGKLPPAEPFLPRYPWASFQMLRFFRH